jgi:hypothetical protein
MPNKFSTTRVPNPAFELSNPEAICDNGLVGLGGGMWSLAEPPTCKVRQYLARDHELCWASVYSLAGTIKCR